jgi:hypothetical protein
MVALLDVTLELHRQKRLREVDKQAGDLRLDPQLMSQPCADPRNVTVEPCNRNVLSSHAVVPTYGERTTAAGNVATSLHSKGKSVSDRSSIGAPDSPGFMTPGFNALDLSVPLAIVDEEHFAQENIPEKPVNLTSIPSILDVPLESYKTATVSSVNSSGVDFANSVVQKDSEATSSNFNTEDQVNSDTAQRNECSETCISLPNVSPSGPPQNDSGNGTENVNEKETVSRPVDPEFVPPNSPIPVPSQKDGDRNCDDETAQGPEGSESRLNIPESPACVKNSRENGDRESGVASPNVPSIASQKDGGTDSVVETAQEHEGFAIPKTPSRVQNSEEVITENGGSTGVVSVGRQGSENAASGVDKGSEIASEKPSTLVSNDSGCVLDEGLEFNQNRSMTSYSKTSKEPESAVEKSADSSPSSVNVCTCGAAKDSNNSCDNNFKKCAYCVFGPPKAMSTPIKSCLRSHKDSRRKNRLDSGVGFSDDTGDLSGYESGDDLDERSKSGKKVTQSWVMVLLPNENTLELSNECILTGVFTPIPLSVGTAIKAKVAQRLSLAKRYIT